MGNVCHMWLESIRQAHSRPDDWCELWMLSNEVAQDPCFPYVFLRQIRRHDVALVGTSYITIWNWTDATIPFITLDIRDKLWDVQPILRWRGVANRTCMFNLFIEPLKKGIDNHFKTLLWMNFSKLVWFNFSWLFIIEFFKCCNLYIIYHHRKFQVVVFVYLSTNYHYVRDPDFLTPKKIGKLVTNHINIIKSGTTSSLYALNYKKLVNHRKVTNSVTT